MFSISLREGRRRGGGEQKGVRKEEFEGGSGVQTRYALIATDGG
jgi:hypothetical protein